MPLSVQCRSDRARWEAKKEALEAMKADDLPFLAATGAVPQNINYAVKADYARPLVEQPAPRPAAASRMLVGEGAEHYAEGDAEGGG